MLNAAAGRQEKAPKSPTAKFRNAILRYPFTVTSATCGSRSRSSRSQLASHRGRNERKHRNRAHRIGEVQLGRRRRQRTDCCVLRYAEATSKSCPTSTPLAVLRPAYSWSSRARRAVVSRKESLTLRVRRLARCRATLRHLGALSGFVLLRQQ